MAVCRPGDQWRCIAENLVFEAVAVAVADRAHVLRVGSGNGASIIAQQRAEMQGKSKRALRAWCTASKRYGCPQGDCPEATALTAANTRTRIDPSLRLILLPFEVLIAVF
jgi:hypothetical protein